MEELDQVDITTRPGGITLILTAGPAQIPLYPIPITLLIGTGIPTAETIQFPIQIQVDIGQTGLTLRWELALSLSMI